MTKEARMPNDQDALSRPPLGFGLRCCWFRETWLRIHRAIEALRRGGGVGELKDAGWVGCRRAQSLPVRLVQIVRKLNVVGAIGYAVATDSISAVAEVTDCEIRRGAVIRADIDGDKASCGRDI